MYRGFDCGVDIRIPPLIEEVTYSGICDAEDATNCRCFVIHTNNIFEGYRCMITTFKVFISFLYAICEYVSLNVFLVKGHKISLLKLK